MSTFGGGHGGGHGGGGGGQHGFLKNYFQKNIKNLYSFL